MDGRRKLLAGGMIGIVILFAALTFIGRGSNGTAPGQPANGSSATSGGEQQKRCESVMSAEAISDFSDHPYEYQEETTDFAGDFSCFYMTASGPGSRTIDFKLVHDPDKILYEAARGISDNISPAPEYGEGYYLRNSFQGSDVPEWSLHVHHAGKTYIVDVIQHKPEAETKAFMRRIFDSLVSIKL